MVTMMEMWLKIVIKMIIIVITVTMMIMVTMDDGG